MRSPSRWSLFFAIFALSSGCVISPQSERATTASTAPTPRDGLMNVTTPPPLPPITSGTWSADGWSLMFAPAILSGAFGDVANFTFTLHRSAQIQGDAVVSLDGRFLALDPWDGPMKTTDQTFYGRAALFEDDTIGVVVMWSNASTPHQQRIVLAGPPRILSDPGSHVDVVGPSNVSADPLGLSVRIEGRRIIATYAPGDNSTMSCATTVSNATFRERTVRGAIEIVGIATLDSNDACYPITDEPRRSRAVATSRELPPGEVTVRLRLDDIGFWSNRSGWTDLEARATIPTS